MRSRSYTLVLACALGLLPQAAAWAQRSPAVALTYQATRSNAGPGQCGCFFLQGGSAQVSVPVVGPLSIAGEIAGGTKSKAYLGYDVSLITYTVGPQLRLTRGRFEPFAEALLGGAHGSGLPFGTTGSTSANSFALVLGGGVDVALSAHFALRAVEADYLHTELPNTGNNRQNNLRLGAGLRFRFR